MRTDTTMAEQAAIPKNGFSDTRGREIAREQYWSGKDYDEYECPDCGRGLERAGQFDVHHKDSDPTNNDPENLVALCRRCHAWRHHGSSISGLDVEEWKEGFLTAGSEAPE